ncbi:RecX family transcriptional regulator [Deinococcus sp. QL22]|uniref:RecX family transcriptional regulator n=1 Tax=Deinococcus sp. QL22 TaxID=2939437 RepID=UPI0020174882|nr:RecX family transcriptional regulator [Deinococcus sp. QL22]UQN05520.1 RecX family transcriptional regulator [Deinococcus sp. QL22]
MSFRPKKPRPSPDLEGERPAKPARVPTPEEARDNLLAYAFRALGARALTAAELRAKLQRRSDDEALIEQVLERVQELGYQDDAQVAQAEGARRGIGGFRVRQTLKRRGVTAPLIDETMQARDPDDEQTSATELLSRRWPSLSRKRDPRSSAYGFLARRGFPGSVIWNAIREVSAEHIDDEDAVEPEFIDDDE